MNVEMMRATYPEARETMSPAALPSSRCQACMAYPCRLNPFLSSETVTALSERGVTRTLSSEQFAGGIEFAELADSLNVLVCGSAMAEHHSPEGARTVLRFFHPGDVIHFKAPSEDGSKVSFRGDLVFRPLTQIRLCLVPMTLLNHEIELGGLIELACGEICDQYARQILLGKMTAYQRLAYFLYHECAREQATTNGHSGTIGHGPIALVLPMVRADIADYLGVNLETVSRSFTRLKRDGCITLPKPNTVVIPDPAVLKAQFDSAL